MIMLKLFHNHVYHKYWDIVVEFVVNYFGQCTKEINMN